MSCRGGTILSDVGLYRRRHCLRRDGRVRRVVQRIVMRSRWRLSCPAVVAGRQHHWVVWLGAATSVAERRGCIDESVRRRSRVHLCGGFDFCSVCGSSSSDSGHEFAPAGHHFQRKRFPASNCIENHKSDSAKYQVPLPPSQLHCCRNRSRH